MKKKVHISKITLLILSISFVLFFLIMLTLSILVVVFSDLENGSHKNVNNILTFLNWLSHFDAINDPFSIFIEILSSIGGVFFGIRIGQWIDAKEEKEHLTELWEKTYRFLDKLENGIKNNSVSIYELAEYKIYWDSLQRADNAATRLLQSDDRYIDISFAFSFLTFYNNSWSKYNSINEWKANVPTLEKQRILSWISSLEDLTSYSKDKACIV